jgi:hypothetical protein
MTLCKKNLPLIVIGMISGLAGCGSASLTSLTQSTQPTSVLFIEAPPSSLAVNASATIDAAATYALGVPSGTSNEMVTYSVTCGSAGACGSFSASDEGGAIVYKAPSAIPSGATVTITATSVADTALSVSATITIVPPIPISVSFPSAMPASLQVNATVTFNATIANDTSTNPQVKWTVTCGASACSSFNPTTTASEAATYYTAPAAIPPGNTVTVTATSVTDPSKSASITITITAAAPTLANGTYVFQLSGPLGSNASFITGVLVAQNGVITGGEQDFAEYSEDSDGALYSTTQFDSITSGSYTSTPDGNLQITYNSGYGVYTLNGVLASGSQGFVAQLYGSLGRGTLDLQTSTAAPEGGYAISLFGGDPLGDPAWIGGILTVDSSGGISGTGSSLDFIDEGNNGYLSGEESLAASTVGAPDQFGRVQFQLNPGSSSTIPVLYLAGYIVDSTHIRLVETGDNAGSNSFQGVLGGIAIGQGTSTGKFSSASLAGSSYVFGATGEDTKGTLQVAGVLTANAGGSVSGTLNWNDLAGGVEQSPRSFTGSWTVDPTGRATLSKLTDGATFNYSLHLYLAGDGNGLLLSSDTADTFAGQAFQQQTGAFTAASFNGSYGISAVQNNYVAASGGSTTVGSVTAVAGGNGVDTLAGFADSGNGNADFAITGNLTASSNGVFTGTLTGLDPTSRTTENDFAFYLADNTRAVAIETDNTQLTLGYLELLQ